jgi:hypothetical protein
MADNTGNVNGWMPQEVSDPSQHKNNQDLQLVVNRLLTEISTLKSKIATLESK